MRTCIIYDTKRNSTNIISNWIKKELEDKNIEVNIFKVNEFDGDFNYDLFIIGSPIYYERPLKGISNFIENNSYSLNKTKVAIFIVCMAKIFGNATGGYIKKHYLFPLEKYFDNLIISSAIFEGWLRKENLKEKEKIKIWINELIKKMEW
ncbi:flavodoxin domain-containing protein [Marinitoga sp. 38H-ov]|uniref:flavodoxin domain-containing protein n=1 Tax=Marinitoga sp. 38H-ov TaxID=1755814 RepID=UPI0013EE00D3|nr:flavodoxin domain-containing protein [Marinitoga sp. 38H-ov]KAF2955919.1 hypothetical protein AS160_08110 [Marinitoga sp. 38H-ov]